MDNLLIRNFRIEDGDAVVAITKAAWGGVNLDELREKKIGRIEGKSWQEHKSSSVLEQCKTHPDWALIGTVDGEVVGYATMAISPGGEIGTVGNNAVDPRWQGRGIGTKLVAEVVLRLEDAGVRLLEVATQQSDLPAQRVYEKLGFEEFTRSIYYFRLPSSGDTLSGRANDRKSSG